MCRFNIYSPWILLACVGLSGCVSVEPHICTEITQRGRAATKTEEREENTNFTNYSNCTNQNKFFSSAFVKFVQFV